jgi:Ran GTPase-activating protein 1
MTADVELLLASVDPALVEDVRLGGNTIGVEAAHALAEFLVKATKLKVCLRLSISELIAPSVVN